MRRLILAATMVAGSIIPAASHAATCTGPVSQNCTYVKNGKTQSCDVYAGTASGSSGNFVCVYDDGVTVNISTG